MEDEIISINLTDRIDEVVNVWHNFSGAGVTAAYEENSMLIVVPMTVLYSLILMLGVVGNVSTCIVIAKNKHMHTATNYYLFSLAVSDLLLLLSGLPMELFYLLFRYPYVFGEAVCILTGLIGETSANATVLTITAFTVERYVAICHPFFTQTVSKLSRAIKFIMLTWLSALFLAIPQAIQFGLVETTTLNSTEGESKSSTQCTLKKDARGLEHAFEISTLVFFILPMTLITLLYILIGLKLRRSRLLKRPSFSNIAERQKQKNQNHVIRMLVVVVVSFFICWAPFHAQRLLAIYASQLADHSKPMVAAYNLLTYVSGILYYLSTTINPLLYNIMSHKFRDAFKSTLSDFCGWSEKKSLDQRRYTVLSRVLVHQSSRIGNQTSMTWEGKRNIKRQNSCSTNESSRTNLKNRNDAVSTVSQPGAVFANRVPVLQRSKSQFSANSANTISNSSLQDLDEPEFTGPQLADYIAELNKR